MKAYTFNLIQLENILFFICHTESKIWQVTQIVSDNFILLDISLKSFQFQWTIKPCCPWKYEEKKKSLFITKTRLFKYTENVTTEKWQFFK